MVDLSSLLESEVTLILRDDFDMWKYIAREFNAQLPLSALPWSHEVPSSSSAPLNLKIVSWRDAVLAEQKVGSEATRHFATRQMPSGSSTALREFSSSFAAVTLPGTGPLDLSSSAAAADPTFQLHTRPLMTLLVVRCEDPDVYRTELRPIVVGFLDDQQQRYLRLQQQLHNTAMQTTRTYGTRSIPLSELASAPLPEWLIVYLPMGNRSGGFLSLAARGYSAVLGLLRADVADHAISALTRNIPHQAGAYTTYPAAQANQRTEDDNVGITGISLLQSFSSLLSPTPPRLSTSLPDASQRVYQLDMFESSVDSRPQWANFMAGLKRRLVTALETRASLVHSLCRRLQLETAGSVMGANIESIGATPFDLGRFLLFKEMAAVIALQMQLPDDALRHYDELEATLHFSVQLATAPLSNKDTSASSESDVGVNEQLERLMEPGPLRLAPILEASVETFRCAIIDTLSSVHLGKEGGHSNLVEIFRYIFARQSRLLLLLGQPLEVARRAVVFISWFSRFLADPRFEISTEITLRWLVSAHVDLAIAVAAGSEILRPRLPASHLLLLRSLLSDLLAAALLAVDKLDCLEPSATTSSCFLHWFLAEGFSDKIGKSASPDETSTSIMSQNSEVSPSCRRVRLASSGLPVGASPATSSPQLSPSSPFASPSLVLASNAAKVAYFSRLAMAIFPTTGGESQIEKYQAVFGLTAMFSETSLTSAGKSRSASNSAIPHQSFSWTEPTEIGVPMVMITSPQTVVSPHTQDDSIVSSEPDPVVLTSSMGFRSLLAVRGELTAHLLLLLRQANRSSMGTLWRIRLAERLLNSVTAESIVGHNSVIVLAHTLLDEALLEVTHKSSFRCAWTLPLCHIEQLLCQCYAHMRLPEPQLASALFLLSQGNTLLTIPQKKGFGFDYDDSSVVGWQKAVQTFLQQRSEWSFDRADAVYVSEVSLSNGDDDHSPNQVNCNTDMPEQELLVTRLPSDSRATKSRSEHVPTVLVIGERMKVSVVVVSRLPLSVQFLRPSLVFGIERDAMTNDADPVEWCLQPEPIDSMTTYSIFGTTRFEWTARVMPTKWLDRRAETSDLPNFDGSVGDHSDQNIHHRVWGLSLARVDLCWHIGTSQVKFCQNFSAFQFTWSLRFNTAIPVFSMSLLDNSDNCAAECDPEALLNVIFRPIHEKATTLQNATSLTMSIKSDLPGLLRFSQDCFDLASVEGGPDVDIEMWFNGHSLQSSITTSSFAALLDLTTSHRDRQTGLSHTRKQTFKLKFCQPIFCITPQLICCNGVSARHFFMQVTVRCSDEHSLIISDYRLQCIANTSDLIVRKKSSLAVIPAIRLTSGQAYSLLFELDSSVSLTSSDCFNATLILTCVVMDSADQRTFTRKELVVDRVKCINSYTPIEYHFNTTPIIRFVSADHHTTETGLPQTLRTYSATLGSLMPRSQLGARVSLSFTLRTFTCSGSSLGNGISGSVHVTTTFDHTEWMAVDRTIIVLPIEDILGINSTEHSLEFAFVPLCAGRLALPRIQIWEVTQPLFEESDKSLTTPICALPLDNILLSPATFSYNVSQPAATFQETNIASLVLPPPVVSRVHNTLFSDQATSDTLFTDKQLRGTRLEALVEITKLPSHICIDRAEPSEPLYADFS